MSPHCDSPRTRATIHAEVKSSPAPQLGMTCWHLGIDRAVPNPWSNQSTKARGNKRACGQHELGYNSTQNSHP